MEIHGRTGSSRRQGITEPNARPIDITRWVIPGVGPRPVLDEPICGVRRRIKSAKCVTEIDRRNLIKSPSFHKRLHVVRTGRRSRTPQKTGRGPEDTTNRPFLNSDELGSHAFAGVQTESGSGGSR